MNNRKSLNTYPVKQVMGAAGAVQLMKRAFGLSEADILGGAGQLEVATAVSPLQLVIDDIVEAADRHLRD